MGINNQPLAIVGLGCRFPGGVTDTETYWQMLINRVSGITEVPANRWNWKNYYHPNGDAPDRMTTKWGGFLDNYTEFDGSFFGLSPREAIHMDVQQRWSLETSWDALENAGIAPGTLRGGKVGVFIGISSHDQIDAQRGDTSLVDIHTGTGNALSISANRISYYFDLKGPSIAIDTACSSSLVAVQLACQSIWSGESSLALAGGVNSIINPSISISFSRASMLSPTGTCYAFDHRANGYVRSEGVGVAVIKPLSQALEDGDRIHAVIRTAVVNQDGRTSSLTIPNMYAQEDMLREAYRQAGVDTRDVAYIEAHGTGTPVGDPIEARALGNVLGKDRPADDPCLIGSVKTNIGHLECASGMAGLIKACLILQHQIIPPQLNFEKANPNIRIDEIGLEVVDEARTLPRRNNAPAILGVNSFGFGGTNAHIVLEQAPVPTTKQPKPRDAARPFVLPISAYDEHALQTQTEAYLDFLRTADTPLEQIATAAGSRREHLHQRLVVIGKDVNALRSSLLDTLSRSNVFPSSVIGSPSANPASPVFVFTGQGSQWWGMGSQLLEREPIFRRKIEEIDALLMPLTGWTLIEELSRDEQKSRIDDTDVAQPAIFALQVGLVALWKSWGIHPKKVVGHSVGEVAAAYIAGIYSLADAVTIIYHRSRLQHRTRGNGAMIAVGVSAAEAEFAINSHHELVQVGAVNSPSMVTLAGEVNAVESLAARFEAEGKFMRRLPINYAFHSYQMDEIQSDLLSALKNIQPCPATIPFISTVTGSELAGETMDAEYWWRNVRQPVRFADAITGLIQSGETAYLEIGSHPSLQNSLYECLAANNTQGKVFYSLRRDSDESMDLLGNLAGLHIYGVPVDWSAVNQGDHDFVNLPTYPWQRQTYWYESKTRQRFDLTPHEHPLLGMRMASPHPTWQTTIDPGALGWLNDHKLWDVIVFPATGFAEMVLAVARALFPDEPYVIEALEMKKALFVSTSQLPAMQIVFDENDRSVSIYSAIGDNEDWQIHAKGYLLKFPASPRPAIDLAELKQSFPFLGNGELFYQAAHSMGYQWGEDFQHIHNIWGMPGHSLSEMVVGDTVHRQFADYILHPAVLDACAQTFSAAGEFIEAMKEGNAIPFLPAEFGRIRLYAEELPSHFWVETKFSSKTNQSMIGDLRLYDDRGDLLVEITDYRFDRVKQRTPGASESDVQIYQFQWREKRLKDLSLPAPASFRATETFIAGLQNDSQVLDDYFTNVAPLLDSSIVQLIQNYLVDLGWDYPIGRIFSLDELMLDLGIIQRWKLLLKQHLSVLVLRGMLDVKDTDHWQVVQQPVFTDESSIMDALHLIDEKYNAEIDLVKSLAGSTFSKILRGRVDLLSAFSSGVLASFQQKGAEATAIHKAMQAILQRIVEQTPADRPLRILEVGAGEGAFTTLALSVLPADRTEYTATDTSSKVVSESRQKFSAYPFVKWRQYDPSSGPSSQGIDVHGYDLVLDANIFDALPMNISQMATCLATDGLFVSHRNISPSLLLATLLSLLGNEFRNNTQQVDQLFSDVGFREMQTLLLDSTARDAICLVLAPETVEAQSAILPEPETILIFGDQSDFSENLSSSLRNSGFRVVKAIAGGAFNSIDSDTYEIDPGQTDELTRLLSIAHDDHAPLVAIIHCWGLDHIPTDASTNEQMLLAQQKGALHILHLARSLDRAKLVHPPQVFILTRDVQSVLLGDRSDGISSAPIIGVMRVANNEMPAYGWRLIDLDAKYESDEIQNITREIVFPDGELEIAYRGGRRYVNRLQNVKVESLPIKQKQAGVSKGGADLAFRLQFEAPGSLTNLSINQTTRRDPEADEIEVQVKAGGINFRDVMKTLGMYPGNPRDLTWLGDDFAGTVLSVGANVQNFKPGDAVSGMALYAFRSHLNVNHRAVFKIPAGMTFEEAASLPTVFLTAYYAIVHLAQMRAGEKILIHAGTGGVGQAAIQVAKDIGLEIYATAGTPEKRTFLKEQGIQHIFDSRSLDFAEEILRVTNGRGVDAVLNSLAGDFIPKNFSVLAPFGRYLEIGKVDVYNNSKIGLEALRNNISVHIIDLAQLMEHRPYEFAEMLEILRDKFEKGIYSPIPVRVFPITEAVQAFRYMASGKHIGKNILSFNVDDLPVGEITEEGFLFKPDVTYLITGGAGGFGLEVAKWMVCQGARHLALMSRNGPQNESAIASIAALEASGVHVMDLRGDVTKQEDVERVVRQIQEGDVPLAGVVHCAMVLRDKMIINMTDDDFMDAFLPKMLGAWNLHRATLSIPLDHFISFSSISSIIGTGGQANYSAGNTFLDAVASHRRARGLPALTINWGVIGDAGVVARDAAAGRFMMRGGVKPIPSSAALAALQTTLKLDVPQLGIASIDWNKLSRYLLWVANSGVFETLTQQEDGGGSSGDLAAQIVAAKPDDRQALVESFISKMVAKILNTSIDQVNRDVALKNFGLDSLMTIELSISIGSQLNLTLTAGDISSNATIRDVAAVIVERVMNNAGKPEKDGGIGAFDSEVDLIAEAVLPSDIQVGSHFKPAATSSASIFLTGATGFLGSYLLADFLQTTNADVYCLVRASDEVNGMRRLRDSLSAYGLWRKEFEPRIRVLVGDLALPAFGLSDTKYRELAEKVDVIYHNGAELNLIQPYSALKSVNVSSVEETLRLACHTHIKPVHYISTIAVFFSSGGARPEPASETDYPDPTELRGGYIQTKWVAEQLIRQAHERGIPCSIYRPGIITGDSRTGATNTVDLASRLVKGSYQLAMVPDQNMSINIVPVDYVSRGIAHLSARQDAPGQVFHLTNPQSTPLNNLLNWTDTAKHLREVSYKEWRDVLIQQAAMNIENDLLPLLPLFPPDSPEQVIQKVDCKRTAEILSNAGVECPPFDERLAGTYYRYLSESGFLNV
jgi:thioester reductase-like protein